MLGAPHLHAMTAANLETRAGPADSNVAGQIAARCALGSPPASRTSHATLAVR
jgi:hypothetical protein